MPATTLDRPAVSPRFFIGMAWATAFSAPFYALLIWEVWGC